MELLELPFAAPPIDPIPCRSKEHPEDFLVEEVPAYLPQGSGDHAYAWIEKRGLDTEQVARQLSALLETPPRDAGWAGLKDRHAVTRQWLSFPYRGDLAVLRDAVIPGLTVLRVERHQNKLRTGHLHGNRFELRLRGEGLASRFADVERTLAWLTAHGAPNYYGIQRFGRDKDNVVRARRWIVEGGRAPFKPFERKLLVSALQSALFNELLAARVQAGELGRVIDGDVARKEETGGLFVVDDVAEAQGRADRLELSATGPMVGIEMRWPEREALARERAAMQRFGLTDAMLAGFRKAGAGTRRPYRILPTEASCALEGDAIVVRFTLPPGSYATEILRELTRGGATEYRPPRPPRDAGDGATESAKAESPADDEGGSDEDTSDA